MLSPLADLRRSDPARPDPARPDPARPAADPAQAGLAGARSRRPARADTPSLDMRAIVRMDVIPRLRAALGAGPSGAGTVPAERPGERGEVLALADAVLADDIEGACRRVAVLRAGGRSLESIFLHVLAPTACHLRDLWSEDLCGLADVTLALCNLRTLLRRHADAFAAGAETGRRVLVVSAAPGGIDVGLSLFELTMAALFFRREGWQPRVERGLAHPAVRDAVRGEWFDLVAILAPDADGGSNAEGIVAVASGIRAVRRDAPNPAMGVVVCGAAFARSPELAARVGADGAALDPVAGVALAGRLVARASWGDGGSRSGRRRRAS